MRPMASICCSPPESFVPWLDRRSFRFGNSSKMLSRSRPPERTLRPRSVTTSPESTSKLAPCNTCDSPYQACSPSTARSGASVGLSITDSEISLAHGRIGGHGRIVALCEHTSAREHRDAVREIGNDTEVMLDHENGAAGGDSLDQGADTLDVLVPHARHGLVEQQHFRVERQCRGNLQGALAAVRQFNRRSLGKRLQSHIVEQRQCPLVEGIEHPL